jgi:hypothetical protein
MKRIIMSNKSCLPGKYQHVCREWMNYATNAIRKKYPGSYYSSNINYEEVCTP